MDEETGQAVTAEPSLQACCCDSPHFTRREVEIILLLAAGSNTDRLAALLSMSPHTATHHLGNMLRRSGSGNRTELVARAYACGVLVAGRWPPEWSGRYCMAAVPRRPAVPHRPALLHSQAVAGEHLGKHSDVDWEVEWLSQIRQSLPVGR